MRKNTNGREFKISIIVPIYNAEKYLKRSIESIQNQTIKDIQIILINDGSTDNSLLICRELEKLDNRITIIDKPNGGVSSARNIGINNALGEYIGFVDPDDWIEPNMYLDMYNQSKHFKTQMTLCNYVDQYLCYENLVSLNIEKVVLNRKEIIHELIVDMISPSTLNSNSGTVIGSVWRIIVKKDLVEKHNIHFDENIPLMEDLIFTIESLLRVENISVNKGHFYHYFHNSSSAVNKYRKNFSEINHVVFHKLEHILKSYEIDEDLHYRMNIRYVNMKLKCIINEVHRDNKKNIFKKIESIKNNINDHRLKAILSRLNTKDYSIRKKIVLYWLRRENALFLCTYYTLTNKIKLYKRFNKSR